MQSFSNSEGSRIVFDLIKAIQKNKQYLSDIDGAIGDGDHGINMSKGFTMCEKELIENPGDLSHSFLTLSKVLMTDIGGSMGPLYGILFKRMGTLCKGRDTIDGALFGQMLLSAVEGIKEIGNAEVGDKTLLDTLIPAINAYKGRIDAGRSFEEALGELKIAAVKGRDSTKEMIAKVGRASRLGERSRGVLDAGATSCCIILETMAECIVGIIRNNSVR